MKKLDYRIISFERVREKYQTFLEHQETRKQKGQFNEFEADIDSIEELEKKLGFHIRSILVVFVPYVDEKKLQRASKCNLSVHAVSIDYHILVKEYLGEIRELLFEESDRVYLQCDNGLFNERFFAIQSGLCKKGMNALAIHPQYGSYGILGLLVSDKIFEEKSTNESKCCQCKKCMKACPTQAISLDGVNGNICLSYLTQKKNLTEEEKELLKKGKKVYGCDICQQVCPENQRIIYCENEDFGEDLMYNIELEDLVSLSNKEFKREYGNRNFAWRVKSILLRNIELVEDE